MSFKLFVDDTRECPPGFQYARDYDGAITLCRLFDFDFMDLDYSLDSGRTGLDILYWLNENGKMPDRINIHSSNERGRKEMADYISGCSPCTTVTMHSL